MRSNRKAISEVVDVNPRIPTALARELKREVDFVPMAQLSEQGYVTPNGSRKLGDVLKGYTYFENGDVIIAKITPCMENGKAAFVDNLPHQIGFGSTEFHVLRPGDSVDGRYLFHMVWSSDFRNEAVGNMTGSAGQKRVPKAFFDRFAIPLPPLSEQKRIADILDKADAIRRKQQWAVTIFDELLKSYFVQMFGNPVQNPMGWKAERLGDIATLDRGKSRHRPRDAKFLYGGSYPLVQTGDITNSNGFIRDYSQTYSEEGLAQSKLWPAGTLCITIAANIGKTAVLTFDACFPDSVVGLIAGEKLTIEYVRHWFVAMEKATDAAATQVAQKNINLEYLRNLSIQVPPITKQKKFSNVVNKVRQSRENAEAARVRATTLFNALVQFAFNGEL